MKSNFTQLLFVSLMLGTMAFAGDQDGFYCKYCGEKFSSASSARVGYCTQSASHKHVAIQGGRAK